MASRPVVAGGLAGALLLATTLIGEFEGKSNDPYRDIVGVPTVCYGETRVPMRHYTDEECSSMLSKAAGEFQKEVLEVTPVLVSHPYQLAAATSLAYNIGITNYKKSSARTYFNSGNFREACLRFAPWNKVKKNGVLKESRGLANRRSKETSVCLKGL